MRGEEDKLLLCYGATRSGTNADDRKLLSKLVFNRPANSPRDLSQLEDGNLTSVARDIVSTTPEEIREAREAAGGTVEKAVTFFVERRKRARLEGK